MEIKYYFSNFILLFIYFSCTSNPFWDDPKTNVINIYGEISLDQSDRYVYIFVWAENFNNYVRADKEGLFSLNLDHAQTETGNINGPINIYFFVHNYTLDSATVFFTDGEFSSVQTDFSSEGKLMKPIILKKKVSLFSYFFDDQYPDGPIVYLSQRDSLRLVTKINVLRDTRISNYNNVLSHQEYLPSGVLFNKINDGNIYLYRLKNDQLHTLEYFQGENRIFNFDIYCDSLEIPDGLYEVIPIILVDHQKIPVGLIDAMGGKELFGIHKNYSLLPTDFLYDTLNIIN